MTDTAVRALHVLIARCHLALACERDMTDEEWNLAGDLARWYKRRQRRA